MLRIACASRRATDSTTTFSHAAFAPLIGMVFVTIIRSSGDVSMRLIAGPVWAAPAFVGFGIGYLSYDGIHYATHHFRMPSRIGRWLKRYHMVHHHTGENARWGVSSPLWDWVFGTMGETKKPTTAVVSQS